MTIFVISVIAAIVTHAVAAAGGAYLFYRFGSRTVKTAAAAADAFKK